MKRSAKKKRSYKRRSKNNFKLKKETVYTVAAIWFWLIAGMITLSFFGDGPVLEKVRNELRANFGWGMFVLPPYLVSLSLLFFRLKATIAQPSVPLGLGILLVSLFALTQAGLVGEAIFGKVVTYIGPPGAMLTFITTFVIGLMILFNGSLDKIVGLFIDLLGRMTSGVTGRASEWATPREKALGKVANQQLKIKGVDEKFLPPQKTPPPMITSPATNKSSSTPSNAAVSSHKEEEKLKINMPMANIPGEVAAWEYPPVSLLSDGPGNKVDRGNVRTNADVIEKTLESFGITAKVVEVNAGPAVTQYALKIALGTKVSRITSLSSDLALALAASTGSVRIEAPIPGRDLVGIEIPNRGLEFVTLKRMMQSDVLKKAKSKLAVALGLDVSGAPVIADINKMPHVLVAGTTGSGKSVLVNVWIASLLFRTTPQEVRIILIDPKRVELIGYNGIPHLLTPVIVEPEKILSSLRWAVAEMENRYTRFAEVGVRNVEGFNELSGFQAMPYIVIFIDELADLMAFAPTEIEDSICRLAQKARAAGIHLILATQRPSVDVITGLIKANVPARLAFNVSSMVDSRVILDQPGAEKLLGRGDMLYIPPELSKPTRIQGTYVSEKEVNALVSFIKEKNPPVNYTDEVLSQNTSIGRKGGGGGNGGNGGTGDGKDPLFEEAMRLVCQHDKASASLLQRRLSVGYARAARILDQLEEHGIIGPGEGSKPRDVLIKSPEEYLAAQQTKEG
jgi:DNA segregation ATPase FtsK/SpoIIIE, S-DNA-T family